MARDPGPCAWSCRDRTQHRQERAHLIEPEVELEGWWTSLDSAPEEIIRLYRRHGTHDLFHSEIKPDLDTSMRVCRSQHGAIDRQ